MCDFNLEDSEGAERTVSGSAFHIVGASNTKVLLKCLLGLCTDGLKWYFQDLVFWFASTCVIGRVNVLIKAPPLIIASPPFSELIQRYHESIKHLIE